MQKKPRRLFPLLLALIMLSTFFTAAAGSAASLPVTPTNLQAQVVSGNQVNLSWTHSYESGVGFEVEREQGDKLVLVDLGAGGNFFSDTNLIPNTVYTYRVRAYTVSGYSGYSLPITVITTTAPEAPSSLGASLIADTTASLTWVDNADNETGFKIERKTNNESFIWIGTVKANATTFLDTGLSVGNVYFYRVQAYNLMGSSSYSNEITISTDKPAAPDSLVATTVSPSRVDLTWKDNANNETGFKIERRTGSGSYSQIATVKHNVTFYADTGLSNNIQYSYRVCAYNAAGDSSFSNEAKVLTGLVPEAPSSLVATTVSPSRIDLAWRDNSGNETGFKIEQKTERGNYVQIATVKANVTSYSNTGLKNDLEYTYRVRAYNDIADSPYSNEAAAITGILPVAPVNLKVETISQDRVRLTWDDKSNNERGFWIECKKGSGSFRQIATVAANVTSFTDTDLETGTEHIYRVQAYNTVGGSAYSNEARADTIPLTPTNLVATQSGARIVLTWTDRSSDESGFRIERKSGTGSYTQLDIVSANTTTYIDNDLSSETRYTYRIRAFNSYGNSPYSNEAIATTSEQIETRIKLRIGQASYQVNGQTRSMDTHPIIQESRTLLPLRFVAEALGAEVEWDEEERQVAIVLKNKRLELWINSNLALVNDVRCYIDPDNPRVFPIIVPPGRTMVPLRFISENLGCNVDWNEKTQEVTVIYPAP